MLGNQVAFCDLDGLEARCLQPTVEPGIALPHLGIDRDLELVHDPVGHGRKDQVGFVGRDAAGHGLLGVETAQRQIHQ